ncbi:MAG: hypothetical protein Q8Q54_01190 [Methylococcales bacterium]|nr:hypothetical protein [Methylococcales bacterium]MDP3837516.1 hypothetical protein [Methylococcales bacterium]
MKLILQIALGVTLGIMLSVGILLSGAMLVFVAGSPSTHLFSKVLQPVEQPLVKLPELPAIPAPSTVQPTIQAVPSPAVSTQSAEELAAQQQQDAAHAEKLKKDALFKGWYKKPQECNSPNDYGHATLIKCGNEYSRARIKFEELYLQGKIKN